MPLPQDTTQAAGSSTAYDTLWNGAETVPQATRGVENVMLAHDKLYVVLAVVLIIWLGIVLFLYRTDRRLSRLERSLENGIRQDPGVTREE